MAQKSPKARAKEVAKIKKVLGERDSQLRYPEGLSYESATDIRDIIRRGSTPRMACLATGVSLQRYDRWMARGELIADKIAEDVMQDNGLMPDEDAVCHAFYKMIMSALGRAAADCAVRLKRSPDWRAHAWRMDRIYGKLLDAPTPKVGGKVGPDGLPTGDQDNPAVIIYVPDNGRSTIEKKP